MLLDYTSLLIAIGFSAICLSIILLGTWSTARADKYLLICSIAAGFIVCDVFLYSLYLSNPHYSLATIAFAHLLTGLSILYGAAFYFRLGGSPRGRILIGMASLPIALTPLAMGYDGAGFMLVNLSAAALLALTAFEYWQTRAEAPGAIAGMCGLYLFVGTSFAACALVLAFDGRLVLDGPPANWAEDFNVLSVIAGVPGIGAMTLALNQTRLARAHKREAMTDSLSGLLNRRALFDMIGTEPLADDITVVLFDIDHFKSINDTHGHATGDRVIALFAQALRESLSEGQQAARIGGEEFVLVRPHRTLDLALLQTEQVRLRFAAQVLYQEGFASTTSAGIGIGTRGMLFDQAFSQADTALYRAKREGRDRTVVAALGAGSGVITLPSSRPSRR